MNGEGLQHEDGHSLLLASTNPACVSYDPAYAYELGHIVRDALHRMYGEPGENIFYYLSIYNEPFPQPAEPDDVDVEGILAGLHRVSAAGPDSEGPRAQILASGIAVPWALAASGALAADWGVHADVWSVTSWTELRREAIAVDEWNLMHPEDEARTPYVTRRLADAPGPVVAVSDWMRAVQDQIAPYVPRDFASLGTDGFGLSDTRGALRRHFKVDAPSIVLRVLEQLVKRGEKDRSVLREAIDRYQLEDVAAAPTGNTEATGE